MKIDGVPRSVLEICRVLNDAGHQTYLVGGAVRDALLGVVPKDFDMATSARPEQIIKLFTKTVLTGIKHGTVTVMKDGVGYEVTTFRGEGAYSDGRHPDEVVFLNTIEEDLARRDFTINAIAYNPLDEKFCDPFNGKQDLGRQVIRTVGNPLERFQEDGLRILRAARFAATLPRLFVIEKRTLCAMCRSLDSYAKVSIERVHDEWIKIVSKAEVPSEAFSIMRDVGVLNVTAPELMDMVDCAQNKFHKWDVWAHTMYALNNIPLSMPLLRLAALFHDIGKPSTKAVGEKTNDATFYEHEVVGAEMTDKILRRMKFSNEEREYIVHHVRHHYIRYQSDWADAPVRRWVRKVGLDNVNSLCTLAKADILASGMPVKIQKDLDWLVEFQLRIKNMKETEVIPTSTKVLAVDGRDVMECLGISPGPTVGKILNALLETITDDPALNTKGALLDEARRIYREFEK